MSALTSFLKNNSVDQLPSLGKFYLFSRFMSVEKAGKFICNVCVRHLKELIFKTKEWLLNFKFTTAMRLSGALLKVSI